MFQNNVEKLASFKSASNSKERTGFTGDLSKLSLVALLEILERQNKLLSDRAFIQKLPDRGERIRNFEKQLKDEVERRNEVTDLCEVVSGLTINGKELSDSLEWHAAQSKLLDKRSCDKLGLSDSDDESNPLKIIATHSGAGFHEKKLRIEEKEELLIKPEDIVSNDNGTELESDPYVFGLCSKFDSSEPKERFLPYKCLIHEKEVDTSKVRDLTAATPPISKLNQAKQISLNESLRLQCDQAKHLRETQLRHAAERLRDKGNILLGDFLPPPETTAHYRESMPSDSEEEILDDDAKEERGGVTFPLSNS